MKNLIDITRDDNEINDPETGLPPWNYFKKSKKNISFVG